MATAGLELSKLIISMDEQTKAVKDLNTRFR